jgi:hypothetical protein
MKNLHLILGIAFISIVHSAHGESMLDCPPCGCVACGADLAEWITPPVPDTRLDYFQFYVSAQVSDVAFNAKIYSFNPTTMESGGYVLYDSGPQIATANMGKTFMFDVGGLNLAPSLNYLLALNQMDHGNTGNLVVSISSYPYNGGHGVSRDDIWPNTWHELPGSTDLAFRAVFNVVPEPSTITFLIAVALGGLLWWRRR